MQLLSIYYLIWFSYQLWITDIVPIFFVRSLRFRDARWIFSGHGASRAEVRIQTWAGGHKACAAHQALPGQTLCAFHGMKSVLGELCPASLVSRVNHFYHLPTCHGKKPKQQKKSKTPGSRFPINHLKFGWVAYYLNIWQSYEKSNENKDFSYIS
jgi:hypothetical protein